MLTTDYKRLAVLQPDGAKRVSKAVRAANLKSKVARILGNVSHMKTKPRLVKKAQIGQGA